MIVSHHHFKPSWRRAILSLGYRKCEETSIRGIITPFKGQSQALSVSTITTAKQRHSQATSLPAIVILRQHQIQPSSLTAIVSLGIITIMHRHS
jgi:hypothetical protein